MRKLLQLFNDLSIQFKLGFVLFIPLTFLVYITIEHLSFEKGRLAQAELNTAAFQFIEKLDHTIHNLALERGLSAGFIGSRQKQQQQQQQQQLQSQRKQTSQQLTVLFQELERDKNSTMIFDYDEVVELRQLLRKLPYIRKLVDQEGGGEQTLQDSFEFFSRANAKLLYLIQGGVTTVSQLNLAKQSRALYSLLSIKERASQERGRLNSFFSSGELSTSASIEINHYIHDQHVKLEEFFHHAAPDYVDLYSERIIPMERDTLRPYRELFFSWIGKEAMLERLRGLLGFGGMIDSFKNYVIRGTKEHRLRFEQHYSQVMALLGRYRTLNGVSVGELKQLDIVEDNINAYYQNIQLIPDSTVANRSIVEIDQKVKVNDRPALMALDQLSVLSGVDAIAWFDHSTTRIEQIGLLANVISTELLHSAKSNQKSIGQTYSFYKNGLLLMLLLTMWLAFYVWRQLSSGISHTLEVIRHTEQSGDISARISVVNRDEIGAIGSATNAMFKTYQGLIHEAIEVLNSAAEGKFDKQIYTHYRGGLKDLKTGVNMAVGRIKQSTQAKDNFLASMSHELRTPLTSIIGNSEFLLDEGHCGSGQCPHQDAKIVLGSIQGAGKNQLALVNDILDMSKIESGKLSINESPYDLSLLLSELEQMLSVQAVDAGIQLVLDQKNQETHQLMGDAQRISQILINLIGNAIKFTEQGEVRLTTWVDGGNLVFQVKDSGIGMSPEAVDNLFQRFHQADSSISRRFGGSGLGLYISENLAHLMGGVIDASSEEGVGSIFQLSLPYQPTEITINQQEDGNVSQSALDEKLSGHVLIAEDTPELQLLEKRILESIGVTVTTAHDGQEAIDQVNQNHFDLILMDMQMPNVDGIEATRTLREQGHTLPIIALTANVMQKHRDAFNEAGCDGFLGKPIDKSELRKVLKNHLSQGQQAPYIQSLAEEEVDEELMQIFIESNTQRVATLKQALTEKDWSQVREVAHAIKGSAASFGYPQLSKIAESVQFSIDGGSADEAPQLTMDLLIELGKILP